LGIALIIALEVAEGLAKLHEIDVVHRDLKPSNILFDEKGHAKVADFGLAQVPGGPSMRSQLSTSAPHPGTPAYMSPEQRNSRDYLTPASDIYSLGLVLFELLTGRVYRSQRPGTRATSLRIDVPEWLDNLLINMLSEKPEDRPWDGKEVADHLRNGIQVIEEQKKSQRALAEAEERARQEELEKARQQAKQEAIERAAAAEKAEAEQERLAREKLQAERETKLEADRLAAQKAKQEQLTRQRAEEERLAFEKAEFERKTRGSKITKTILLPIGIIGAIIITIGILGGIIIVFGPSIFGSGTTGIPTQIPTQIPTRIMLSPIESSISGNWLWFKDCSTTRSTLVLNADHTFQANSGEVGAWKTSGDSSNLTISLTMKNGFVYKGDVSPGLTAINAGVANGIAPTSGTCWYAYKQPGNASGTPTEVSPATNSLSATTEVSISTNSPIDSSISGNWLWFKNCSTTRSTLVLNADHTFQANSGEVGTWKTSGNLSNLTISLTMKNGLIYEGDVSPGLTAINAGVANGIAPTSGTCWLAYKQPNNASGTPTEVSVSTNSPFESSLIGNWLWFKDCSTTRSTLVLNADHTFQANSGEVGTWKTSGNLSNLTISLTMKNGFVYKGDVSPGLTAINAGVANGIAPTSGACWYADKQP
jgi:hypothetical protein